ncbi:MAG TPA: glycosyl hydrolase family 18 protein [Longimicrobium sp.]|nr:glycosyl hydrolase family 18 protein [Longimicrobium sp.]
MIPMIYSLKMSPEVATQLSDYAVVLFNFLHCDSDGSVNFNGRPISPGSNPEFRDGIQALSNAGTFVLFSIGGSDSGDDYRHIGENYEAFTANLKALMNWYGIAGIDLDLETADYAAHLDVCTRLVTDIADGGLLVTAAPYQAMPFWKSLARRTAYPEGAPRILSYNLQLYSGQTSYAAWVKGFDGVVPDPQRFLGAGYAANKSTPAMVHDALGRLLSSYPRATSAMVWRYFPEFKNGHTAPEYAQAILSAAGTGTSREAATAAVREHRERLAAHRLQAA